MLNDTFVIKILLIVFSEMEEAGVGSCNPKGKCVYTSPAFLASKPRCLAPRLCVDYSDLNDAVVEEIFPIPNMDAMIESLGGKKWFSILDLKKGY